MQRTANRYLPGGDFPETPTTCIGPLYDELSDFVHLSFRHFWPVMAGTDDENQIAYFAISAQDPKKDEANYFEVTEAFLQVTKMTGIMLVALLMARHSPRPPKASETEGIEGGAKHG